MRTDKRSSYRYPVADEERSGTLTIDGNELPIHLVDQSMGGFSVLTKRRLHFVVGMEAVLRAGTAPLEVRVCSVIREDEGYRLGLQRLRELPAAGECGVAKDRRGIDWIRDKLLSGEFLRMMTLGNLLLMCRVAWDFGTQQVSRHLRKHAKKWKLITGMMLVIACGALVWHANQTAKDENNRLTIRGFLALVAVGVPESLEANEQQQFEIHSVCGQALDTLDRTLSKGTAAKSSKYAIKRITVLLTNEQRHEWDRILADLKRLAPGSNSFPLRAVLALAAGDLPESLRASDTQRREIEAICEHHIDSLDRHLQTAADDVVWSQVSRVLTDTDRRISSILREDQDQRWKLIRSEYNRGALLASVRR